MKSTDMISVPRPIRQECFPVKAGPFGAPHKHRYDEWDDGSHLAVERITLLCNERGGYINGIEVEYRDQTGARVLAPKHGRGAYELAWIEITSAITWLSGYYDYLGDITVINSIKFGTKEGDIHGPYGPERGTQFCFKVEEGICGFHGLADDSALRAIGVYFYSTAKQILGSSNGSTASGKSGEGLSVKAGPFGTPHEGRYVEWDDGNNVTVERIFLTYTKGSYINSIQVEYHDPIGTKVLAPEHGGGGGNTFEVIPISSAITCVSGHYDSLGDFTFIRSLKFGTKEGDVVYGPYGSECGTQFGFYVGEGICGFHGLAAGSDLGAIGVHANSTAKQHLGASNVSANITASAESGEGLPVKAGPSGGTHGQDSVEWDDGSNLAVERIFLTYTKGSYINSIQVEYRDLTGTKVLAPKHGGGGGGDTFEVIQTSCAITRIIGHYDCLDNQNSFIRSLKFGTSKDDIYGLYGSECGTRFCFSVREGIRGFHGLTHGSELRAIGVYANSTAKQHLGSANASINSTAGVESEEGPAVKAGPFGAPLDANCVEWDDGSHLTVEQIYLAYTEAEFRGGYINSIQVEYRDLTTGTNVLSPKHGGGGGDMFEVIQINSAIMEISGTYGYGVAHRVPLIKSLAFHTKEDCIFRSEDGSHGNEFVFKVEEGVCGFHGWMDGWGLRAIGVYINSNAKQQLVTYNASVNTNEEGFPVKAGPFGVLDEDHCVEWDDGSHLAVERIYLTYTKGFCINSIQVAYRDPMTGTRVLAPKHGGGGDGGDTFEVIQVSSAITEVSGTYEAYDYMDEVTCIKSLSFRTEEECISRLRVTRGDTKFVFKVEEGICGFHGLVDHSCLKAIGVHVNSTAKQHLDFNASLNTTASVTSEDNPPVKAGVFGSPHGNDCVEWDDGSHLAVERIYLTYTKRGCINSIQVEYRDPTGTKVLGPKHGGGDGNTFESVKISSAIIGIFVRYCSLITLLEFGLKGGVMKGPYGREHGTELCFNVKEGICGFYGLEDDLGLRAIGVYVNSTGEQHHGSCNASGSSTY